MINIPKFIDECSWCILYQPNESSFFSSWSPDQSSVFMRVSRPCTCLCSSKSRLFNTMCYCFTVIEVPNILYILPVLIGMHLVRICDYVRCWHLNMTQSSILYIYITYTSYRMQHACCFSPFFQTILTIAFDSSTFFYRAKCDDVVECGF